MKHVINVIATMILSSIVAGIGIYGFDMHADFAYALAIFVYFTVIDKRPQAT